MEKHKSKIKIIYRCSFIALAFTLGVSKVVFSLSNTIVYTLYWLLIIAIIASMLIVNQLWYREFIKYVNALMPIITEEKDPNRFIAENEKLLVGKKSAQIIAVLRINICVGYCEKGDYPEAQRQLEAISYKKIHGIQRVIYLADCAYVAFYLEEKNKALEFMEQNRKGIDKLQNTRLYGGLMSVLGIFELCAKNDHERACELYSVAIEKWEDNSNCDDFEHLKKLL